MNQKDILTKNILINNHMYNFLNFNCHMRHYIIQYFSNRTNNKPSTLSIIYGNAQSKTRIHMVGWI